MSRDADCHYGDHDFQGAYCKWCGEENFAYLRYLAIDKAIKDGRDHGDHYHRTIEATKLCEEISMNQNYWYYMTAYYCPQCGRSRTYKERREGPKPIKWEQRHEEIEAWDYCE